MNKQAIILKNEERQRNIFGVYSVLGSMLLLLLVGCVPPQEKVDIMVERLDVIDNRIKAIQIDQAAVILGTTKKAGEYKGAANIVMSKLQAEIQLGRDYKGVKSAGNSISIVGSVASLVYERMYPNKIEEIELRLKPEIEKLKANKIEYDALAMELKELYFELHDLAKHHDELKLDRAKFKLALETRYGPIN